MRRKNVDLMKRRIAVKESDVFISGHPHFGRPKTKKGERTIGVGTHERRVVQRT